jgi:hypothetical protein
MSTQSRSLRLADQLSANPYAWPGGYPFTACFTMAASAARSVPALSGRASAQPPAPMVGAWWRSTQTGRIPTFTVPAAALASLPPMGRMKRERWRVEHQPRAQTACGRSARARTRAAEVRKAPPKRPALGDRALQNRGFGLGRSAHAPASPRQGRPAPAVARACAVLARLSKSERRG